MKLNFLQLEDHLRKTLAPIYLLSSDEITLKQEALTLIRKAAKLAGFQSRLRLALEDDIEGHELYSRLHTISLLDEKQLVELDLREKLPDKNVGQLLSDYAANPSLTTILVLNMNKLDFRVTKSAWYFALEKQGVAIPIWPINHDEFPQWIHARAKKYKMQLEKEAAIFLADVSEGNLSAAAQALEKIYLFMQADLPQKIISKEILETILNDERRFNVFEFTDHLISGDITRSLQALSSLKTEGIEPTLILWSITRELRLLAQYAEYLAAGNSLEHLFNKYKIFYRKQTPIKKFLTKYSLQDCGQFLLKTADIDKIIKGVNPGNIWQALQLFCLRFV